MLAHLERMFWVVGLIGIFYLFFVYSEAHAYRPPSTQLFKASDLLSAVRPATLGWLDIPQLALSVPILPNYDPDSLRKGVGHIPGTATLGGLGTVGLAGHRDTFFRPLRRLTRNMEIQLVDASGTYRYIVDSMEIVTPTDVGVLSIGRRPQLTLITCFPFEYVGAAPKRFIVHAHLKSVVPD
ncbi:MAG: class D sortase [Granulicella sp.]